MSTASHSSGGNSKPSAPTTRCGMSGRPVGTGKNIISGRWDPPLLIQSGAMRGASRSHTVGILRAGSAHYLVGRLSSMADERPGPTRSFARTELAYVMKTWRSPVVNVDSPG